GLLRARHRTGQHRDRPGPAVRGRGGRGGRRRERDGILQGAQARLLRPAQGASAVGNLPAAGGRLPPGDLQWRDPRTYPRRAPGGAQVRRRPRGDEDVEADLLRAGAGRLRDNSGGQPRVVSRPGGEGPAPIVKRRFRQALADPGAAERPLQWGSDWVVITIYLDGEGRVAVCTCLPVRRTDE